MNTVELLTALLIGLALMLLVFGVLPRIAMLLGQMLGWCIARFCCRNCRWIKVGGKRPIAVELLPYKYPRLSTTNVSVLPISRQPALAARTASLTGKAHTARGIIIWDMPPASRRAPNRPPAIPTWAMRRSAGSQARPRGLEPIWSRWSRLDIGMAGRLCRHPGPRPSWPIWPRS